LRVIAGEFKSRRLRTPTWEGLRPTSDKLRETLFNVIAARVPGARVLDLYAGTGAVGIEALSRGASHVTFVDSDARALKLVRENLGHCGVSDRYAIIRLRLPEGTPQLSPAGPFDLVFLDPPYGEPDLTRSIAAAAHLMAPDGLMVVEHARRRSAPPAVDGMHRTRDLIAGDSGLAFYAAAQSL